MSAANVLVVMRLADMARVHPGQDESRVCGRCGEQVGIYPSGQAVLRRGPSTEIVCSVCIALDPALLSVGIPAPGALAEPGQSVSRRRR